MTLTDEQRWALTHVLGMAMREYSEAVYCASWYSGIEDILQEKAKQRMQMLDCSNDLNAMYIVAQILGHWAKPGNDWDEYVPHVPEKNK